MRSLLSSALLSSGLLAATLSASQANAYDDLVIFGDSLSDTGNLQVFSQDPNMPSRFTNGPVAVEVLAAQLGLSVSNALHLTGQQLGNNFAVAGAVAIDEDGDESTPDINLPTQVNSYLAFNGYQADPDTLYVVMIGGNDIRAARTLITQEEHRSKRAANQRLKQATESIKAQLQKLVGAGAQHILVVNAPDIGAIPETDLVAMQLLATAEDRKDERRAKRLEKITRVLSAKYNGRLASVISDVEEESNIDIHEFDLFQYVTDTVENADTLGLTNTDDACIYVFSAGGAMNPECNLDTFLFFDEIHPTTVVHQRAGAALYQSLMAGE